MSSNWLCASIALCLGTPFPDSFQPSNFRCLLFSRQHNHNIRADTATDSVDNDNTSTKTAGSDTHTPMGVALKFAAPSDEGTPLDSELAGSVNFLLTNKLEEKQLTETGQKYLRPSNCDFLVVPKVNPVIWEHLTPATRSNDARLQRSLFLMGPMKQLQRMFQENRFIATLIFFAFLILTVCAAVWWDAALLAILFCVIQFLAFGWYAISYIPFARDTVKNCCGSIIS
ncbi:Vesicle transport protein SFT2A [Holothuria leucospilota]|uniref:Vesicle transport protein n=1 Tax=Holothuria leucospilota TaxID=206669 RepID=A0A9Q0YTI5_HOLLE|nr:Vesicle transport protein SFT2A [Holothuria leucospilota]